MQGFIDIHQHVVYGVDDGPATPEESLSLLEMDCRQGIRYVMATSHAYPAMRPFPLERYLRHLAELNRYCYAEGLPISLLPGCEVFYSQVAVRHLEEGRLPTLANSRFVMLEFDPTFSFAVIEGAIRETANIGLIPVVAHCERYEALARAPEDTAALRGRYPMRLQINCSTILRRPPRPVRKLRDYLLKVGAVDYVATDAHNAGERPPSIREAYLELARVYNEEYALSLTGGNQREMTNASLRPQ